MIQPVWQSLSSLLSTKCSVQQKRSSVLYSSNEPIHSTRKGLTIDQVRDVVLIAAPGLNQAKKTGPTDKLSCKVYTHRRFGLSESVLCRFVCYLRDAARLQPASLYIPPAAKSE